MKAKFIVMSLLAIFCFTVNAQTVSEVEVADLVSLHGKVKPDGDGFQTFKAGQFRYGIFFLEMQFIVDDGLETQQMILGGQHLEVQTVFTENPVEFLRKGQGKEAGQQADAAILHGNVGSRGAEPLLSLVFCCSAADCFLGNIQTGQRRFQGICQSSRVIALSAAHVQNLAGKAQFLCRFDQGVRNWGIEARFQEFPPGQYLLPGISWI